MFTLCHIGFEAPHEGVSQPPPIESHERNEASIGPNVRCRPFRLARATLTDASVRPTCPGSRTSGKLRCWRDRDPAAASPPPASFRRIVKVPGSHDRTDIAGSHPLPELRSYRRDPARPGRRPGRLCLPLLPRPRETALFPDTAAQTPARAVTVRARPAQSAWPSRPSSGRYSSGRRSLNRPQARR